MSMPAVPAPLAILVNARPVPSIPGGSWLAAGNKFIKLRWARPKPITDFRRIVSTDIGNNGIAQGVVAAGGGSVVAIGPSGYGTRWYPNQANLATQLGASDTSTCTGYLNVMGPGGFLFQSYLGGGDQQGLAVPQMQPGDLLYFVWSGATVGNWTQIVLIGQQDILVDF
jgi:hypothetical protein